MNLYGFKCSFRGEDRGSYSHPEFKRGEWEAVKKIRRCVSHSQNLLMSVKLPVDSSVPDSLSKSDVSPERARDSPTSMALKTQSPLPSVTQALAAAPSVAIEVCPAPFTQVVESVNIKLDFKFPAFITITDVSGDAIKLTPMGQNSRPMNTSLPSVNVYVPAPGSSSDSALAPPALTLAPPASADFSEILDDLDDILSY